MMISLMPETVDEDVDAPLETRGHSDDLAGAGQASDRRDDAAEPGCDDLDPVGDRAHSLELVTGLARESTHVLGEPRPRPPAPPTGQTPPAKGASGPRRAWTSIILRP